MRTRVQNNYWQLGSIHMTQSMFQKAIFILIFMASASGCSATREVTELGEPGRVHISYAAGIKLKDNSWENADDETIFGFVDADRRLDSLGSWGVAKLLVGTGDAPDFTTDPDADSAGTSEICLGLRRYTAFGRVEPFVSAGIAVLSAGITGYDEKGSDAFPIEDEVTLGLWGDVGLQVPITESFTLGASAHYSIGPEIDFESAKVQPGGMSVLLNAGWRY